MRWSTSAHTARRANFHGQCRHRRLYPTLTSGSKAGGRTAQVFLIDRSSWIGATTRVIMGSSRSITDLLPPAPIPRRPHARSINTNCIKHRASDLRHKTDGTTAPRLLVVASLVHFADSQGYSRPLPFASIRVKLSKSMSRFSVSLRSGRHFETRCGPLTSHITASAPVFQRYTHPTILRSSIPIKFAIATPSTSSSFTVY